MAQTASHNKHIAAQERLYVAFELGWTKWKLGFCSGRDGFWLDRLLKQMSVENVVVDSGSIKVDRRARRAKTDRLDAEDLVTMLVRYVSGEPKVWHVVHVPSPEQEDARHLQREIRTLKKEQTRIVNRVRGLLASQGVSVKMGRRGLLVPLESLRTWDGSPLPPGLTLRVGQELSRHVVVHEQMLALEAQRHRGIKEEGSANAAMSQRLMELKAIGETTAETLTREVFFRDFKNRRQIGSYSGLTPSRYQSGEMSHESGISRAGNRHLRGIIVDVAWDWLRYQPQSTLARWYQKRFGSGGPRMRKIGIVALARKLLIALWRYAEFGVLPQRAQRKALAA